MQASAARATSDLFDLPGPKPVPLLGPFGNVVQFALDPIGHVDALFRRFGGQLVALAARGGTRIMSPQACPGTIFVYGPELLREVQTHNEIYSKYALSGRLYPDEKDRSPRRQPLRNWETGLFHVNGDEHRQHRRLLMPAFHKTRLDAYVDDMVAITRSALDSWSVGERRDLHHDMMRLTMRIATKTLFGKEIGAEGGPIGRALHESRRLSVSPIAIFIPYDLPGLPYRRFLDLAGFIDSEIRTIIAEKRASGRDDGDMLSMLIAARDEDGGKLTEDEIVGHASVIFSAGEETSSKALTWTLLLLAQHPNIAAALQDELHGVLGGDAPTSEQIGKLTLLDRILKESMRVLPPAPFTGRFARIATELGGRRIPAGTEVMTSGYHTHRMPEIYPNPAKFQPSRWESIKPDPYQYNPFSAGPRACIGAPFAMTQMKLVLALLLQRYRLQLAPSARIDRKFSFTMGPRRGLPMIVHRQDRDFARSRGEVSGNVREMVDFPD